MRKFLIALAVVIALCLTPNLALADPNNVDATCGISVTVDGVMEWAGNFANINLSSITSRTEAQTGTEMVVLYTNGDVTLTAENSTSAQLTNDGASTDTLVTEYKLAFDSTGGTTGNDTPDWESYDEFLNLGAGGTATTVTHADGDGAVEVTLHVRASNDTGQVADSGSYSCTQNITASWGT